MQSLEAARTSKFYGPWTSLRQQGSPVGVRNPGRMFSRLFPLRCTALPRLLAKVPLSLFPAPGILFSPGIKNHLQKATHETSFKPTLIIFFLLPKYCTCRSHVKNFLLKGIGKNVVRTAGKSFPAVHLPPGSHSQFGKMLHIENVQEHRYKRRIAS